MRKKKMHRDRLLKVLLTADELAEFEKKVAGTTSRNTSEYVRSVLLEKPVLCRYRNESLDEFLVSGGAIGDRLGAIERNFIRILTQLRDHPPNGDITSTLSFLLAEECALRSEMREIRSILLKIYDNARSDQDMRRRT